MAEEKKYLYGPVPSRRLGRSLGIDIMPFKVCTIDCIYCQLGGTTEKTLHRGDFVPVETVLAELRDKLAEGLEADFISISGSGEPTLNSRLGELIDGIKKITSIPVAILTNGTLLYRQDVRVDCTRADVVLPSLDAGDEQTFQRINRPHASLSFEKLISGLCAFRKEFAGQIWLEVFLIEGFNTDTEQIAKIKEAIKRIRPDKVQLNTAVRPTAEPGIKSLSSEKLRAIAEELGEKCEVIADFSVPQQDRHVEGKAEDVLSMLKRRPCSLKDICSALGISRNEALKYIALLQQQGVLDSEKKDGVTFFKAN
ncbi:MAG: radical SAM protein [Sedimentisphaerales bacterium]